ncbi:MAG TPA: PhzF family phenazine biosynthesis isomerase [Dermatophilaceae bacterium]|nr:PhzF family phenazine biosynthesis isomerase [Dermatophilaceae bacterium]
MSVEVLRYAAFTECGRGGNPAGVVLDAGSLTDPQMLAIAQAIGYSETSFLTPVPGEAPPDKALEATVRFFSPVAEVAFCGHATIATAIAVAERTGPGVLRLHTQAGRVTVESRFEDHSLVATLTSPPTSTRRLAPALLDETLTALRWTRDDLDQRYPVHVAFAGNQHLMLAVRTRGTLAGLDYDYPALALLMDRQGWTTTHLFWSENATTFHARNPFPPGGVVEDPATGAAAAAFGGYLRDLGLVPVPSRVVVRQGHDLGSPSELLVDLSASTTTVGVTGRATPLALSPYEELAAW